MDSPPAADAEYARLKAEGPLPAARDASKLEFWLHYKLMQATGMEQALGGEDKAIAALKAVSLGFERSATAAQAEMPRMVPTSFDGNGLDAGVAGVGYGLIGGAITSGMLNGLSPEQVSQAAQHGPIKFDDKDGSAEVDIAQNGMDTALEQTVNEEGVTGKVKTKVHLDACPDASGKLLVTIETESQMGIGGKSGSVKAKFRIERQLDDDAHLIDGSDGQLDITMDGTGAAGNLHASANVSGNGGTKITDDRGFSIFRQGEADHAVELMKGTFVTMQAMAEAMLTGGFTGGTPPWETGRCVDLQVRSDPAKRTGAKPNTAYTLFAEPRAKSDGAPTRGTVKATLSGEHMLNPRDKKVPADAQFDYQNPEKKDQSASIDFEARSKRGVGKATLQFDTKKGGYRIALDNGESITTCDITKPFSGKIGRGMITLAFTPADDRSGKTTFHFAGGGGVVDTAYDYTLSGPEEKMTGVFRSNSAICGKAAGLGACATARVQTFTSTWTRIDDCGE